MILRPSRICPREQKENARKTTDKLLEQLQQQFHRILRVFYHFSVSEPIRDSGQRLLTRLEDLWLLDVRELNERNGATNSDSPQWHGEEHRLYSLEKLP